MIVTRQNGWLTGRVLPLPELHANKDDQQDAEQHEERDDAAVGPGVRGAAPLQREQQAHDGGHEDDGADGIELLEALPEADGRALLALGALEEEHDDAAGDGAERQVDVEAPAPGDVVGEGAAHEGAGHAGDAVHGADEARVDGPLPQRHRVGDDEQRAREQPRAAQPRDGPPHDQRRRVGRHAADQAAHLEDEEREQEGPLDAEEGVELAEEQLEGARREQIGRAVPAAAMRGQYFAPNGRYREGVMSYTSERALNSSVILGMAVAITVSIDRVLVDALPSNSPEGARPDTNSPMMVLSRATQSTARHRASVMVNSLTPLGYSTSPSGGLWTLERVRCSVMGCSCFSPSASTARVSRSRATCSPPGPAATSFSFGVAEEREEGAREAWSAVAVVAGAWVSVAGLCSAAVVVVVAVVSAGAGGVFSGSIAADPVTRGAAMRDAAQ